MTAVLAGHHYHKQDTRLTHHEEQPSPVVSPLAMILPLPAKQDPTEPSSVHV